MPGHGYGRCDGHHEMVDSIAEKRASVPATSSWSSVPSRRLHLAAPSN